MLRVINRVAWLFAMVGGLCASLVALMTVVSVTGRAAFSMPIQGDVELTQLGVALCISLCLPWCQVHGANIIVDFFTQKVGPRRQALLDGIGALALATMTALLAWRTAVGAMSIHEASETSVILGLPMWWTYAMLAPGLALTCLVALIQSGLLFSGRNIKEMQA
jgi:TRAP-type C4-dicarboxylate transport system permease small subunit